MVTKSDRDRTSSGVKSMDIASISGQDTDGPLKSSRQQDDLGFSFAGEWLGDGRAPFQVANSPPVRG